MAERDLTPAERATIELQGRLVGYAVEDIVCRRLNSDEEGLLRTYAVEIWHDLRGDTLDVSPKYYDAVQGLREKYGAEGLRDVVETFIKERGLNPESGSFT